MEVNTKVTYNLFIFSSSQTSPRHLLPGILSTHTEYQAGKSVCKNTQGEGSMKCKVFFQKCIKSKQCSFGFVCLPLDPKTPAFYTGSFNAPSLCCLPGNRMAPITIEPSLYADGCQETELHECPPIGAFCSSQTDSNQVLPVW